MSKRARQRRSNCPVKYAADFLGDRWALLIVRDLMFEGKKRYGEMLASNEKIATNVLADRLERLEHFGIVEIRQGPDRRTKYTYGLTNKGIDLVPVLLEIIGWSARHDPRTAAAKALIRRLEKDRKGLIAETVAKLKERKV